MSTLVSTLKKSGMMVVAAAAMSVSFAPVTASAAVSTFGYQGLAFGTSITAAGGAIVSGETAKIAYGCGTPAGLSRTATSAALTVPPLLSVGTTVSTGATTVDPTASTTSSTVQTVNLLNAAGAPLVTANAVKSVASATNNGTSYGVSSAGTTFTGLKVLGLPIAINVAPNTRIALPGIGYVVLNEQRKSVTPISASISVTAIHVVVTTQNQLGYEVGTNIIVARAAAALSAPTGGFLGGFAYGTAVEAAGLLTSSPSFRIAMPCAGTNGVLRENTGAGITVPLVLNSGTIQNTAQGSTTTTADGQTTSTIEDLNVLDGLITATGIRSVATASRAGGVTTLSSAGSSFATITVNGTPLVVADIQPNTVINIAGVGKLTLNKVTKTATAIEVRAIELVIEVAQVGGLPIGARVLVAVANASAR